MTEWLPALGAVFPVNMGNRGQNVLSIPDGFEKIVAASTDIEFVGHHRRISGNFVFRYSADADLQRAASLTESVLHLRCLVRSFSDLAHVNSSVPSNAKAVRGSVIVRTEGRIQRVIFVALSEDAPPEQQFIGALTRKIELIAWPSACDVICLYDRPGAAGDVGQVTQAVVRRVGRSRTNLYGTGRAMSIVRDLLVGRYTKRSDCQFSS